MLTISIVVGLIVLRIVLVVLGANDSNTIVQAIQDAAKFLVGPFKDIFSLSNRKCQSLSTTASRALVYLIIGNLIARLLRR